MKTKIIFIYIFLLGILHSQEKPILFLDQLIDQALLKNLSLNSYSMEIRALESKIAQIRSLENPELTFKLMEMPRLRPDEAMFANLELMQMIRFPAKISTEARMAQIEVDRAQQIFNEKSVDIIMQVKIAYYELWMIQQNMKLNQQNVELMKQVLEITRLQYSVGKTSQQDVLRAEIEIAKLEKEFLRYQEMEETTLAMLASLLNQDISNFTGLATAPDIISFNFEIEQIQAYALKKCSKLRSDSLMVEREKTMHKLSKLEYLPDMKVGIEYVSSPMTGFRGWSLQAGITLPFSLWTLSKANAKVQEAEANIIKSELIYNNERNMLLSKVREYYAKLRSLIEQWELYDKKIIPLAEQSLQLTLTNYQTGKTDFLMLLDTYRMLTMEKMEAIMIRMKFEQTLANLEKEIGCRDIEEILSY